MNPFITTGYAGPEYFCDRIEETKALTDLLMNGNNVALMSPRRYGKTDLIRHCFGQKEISEKYCTFIIDIYSTKSLAEMTERMGKSILDTLKPKGTQAWSKFVNALSSLKGGISYDAAGVPSWTLQIGDLGNPKTTLDEIFAYLSNAEKPCLVAIDEFQQITNYADKNVEATLRTYIQYCPNAKFVFSGSHREMMGSMFTSSARPFYQSATIINLPPIREELYAEFCKKQNIRLVLVTAPLPSAYVQDTQNYQAYVDAMRSFAAANGTQYWDFSLFKDTDLLPIGFDDFSDMHHLNGQGAETFSKAFATVAARSVAGEDVSSLFYDTVAEKLATSPDSTVQQGEGN